jgi:O-antigen ligase
MTPKAKGDAFRRLAAVAFFTAPLGTAIAPHLTTIFLSLLVVVLVLAAMWHGPRWKEALTPSAALAGCLAFSLYIFVNASWSLNLAAGVAKASLLLGLILAVPVASAAVAALNERQTRAFTSAFVAGAALAVLYLLLEMLTDGALTRFVFNWIPAIRPDKEKLVSIANGIVTVINLSELNPSVTTVMLNMWPVMLILAAIASLQRRYALMVAIFVTTTLTVFASKHSSSQVALLASTVVFALAWRWSRPVLRGLAVMWCLAFAFVLPASFIAYDANLQKYSAMPNSFKIRIILWDYTAERTLEHPWLGVGVNSTREMDEARRKSEPAPRKAKGENFPRITGHHGHSVFMQTWHELGVVGAVLFALAGVLVILQFETLPRDVRPYAAAAFTAFASIAAFAWGMWQAWWMCAVGLMAVYLCLGCQRSAGRLMPSSGSRGEASRQRG